MQIAPRDQRRLLYRVCAVLIAMRVVSIFTIDLNATEVAAALGLSGSGGLPWLAQLAAAWKSVAGTVAGVLRLPSIAADLAVLLLTIRYCRVNGWGTLSGLLAGFFLAMAPFGLDEGWRADGTPLLSLGAVSALLLARIALKSGQVAPAVGSSLIVAVMTAVSPVTAMLLPAGLYASARSVTGQGPKLAVSLGWIAAVLGGIGLRLAVGGDVAPQSTLAVQWLADPAMNAAGASIPTSAVDGFLAALQTLSPGGPSGRFAAFLQLADAPTWRVWVGAALWPLAVVGLWRGQVLADPVIPRGPAVSSAGGAGAADGWKSLGVAVPTSPRVLGERDWGPLLLGTLVPAGWVAWASVHGRPDGVTEALAIARPFACLLLGLGLTALAGMRIGAEDGQRKRFVAMMIAFTLLQFGLGGHHVLLTTRADDRVAPHKIASFIRAEAPAAYTIALGAAGLAVAYKLDPWRSSPRVVTASIDPKAASEAVAAALEATATHVVIVGDKDAIEGSAFAAGATNEAARGAGWLMHGQLTSEGYGVIEDGARYLSWFSVRIYEKGDTGGGMQVRPQLHPGVAP